MDWHPTLRKRWLSSFMLQKIRLALVKKAIRVVVYSFSSDIHSLIAFCILSLFISQASNKLVQSCYSIKEHLQHSRV